MPGSTVADVLVDGLARAGVLHLFTSPDLPAGDVLAEAADRRGLSMTPGSAPVLMAAVAATLTGALGAVLLSEEGLLQAGDDLDDAGRGRLPLLVITESTSATTLAAVGAVKTSLTLEPASAAHWTAHAILRALGAPPGPVHIDVPSITARLPAVPMATALRPPPLPAPPTAALDQAGAIVAHAARPVLIAGLDCATPDAAPWLSPLAEALPAPILVTARARGVVPDPHPLVLGLLDGDRPLLDRADLVVTVGLDGLEVPAELELAAPVVHLSPGWGLASTLSARTAVDGAIDVVLAELAPRLRGRTRADWDVAQLDALKRGRRAPPPRGVSPLDAASVARVARTVAPPGTVAIIEEGRASRSLSEAWEAMAPRELLSARAGAATDAGRAASRVSPAAPVLVFMDAQGLNADDVADVARHPVIVIALERGGDAAASAVVGSPRVDTTDAMMHALHAALAASAPALLVTRTV